MIHSSAQTDIFPVTLSMSELLDVSSVGMIPPSLIREFEEIRPELMGSPYTHDIANNSKRIQALMAKLSEYLHERDILIHHYTRAEPAMIRRDGLKLETGEERRKWFLDSYSNLFSAVQLDQIKDAWRTYFGPEQRAREGRLYFVLRLNLDDDDAWPLIEHFGGERIMMPLCDLPEISTVLKKLGKPLVVTARVKSAAIRNSWCDYPAAFVWIASYHAHVNPECREGEDIDGYMESGILPENIVAIRDVSESFPQFA